ncbi:MAG TPA: SDR family NAD(P)-dependent oxidoreductase, partial [Acidimicrobiia bacterium]|nr:SDR family NAD(P)-dependent oxidoreductase [Acidimicrobiia bacterium]
MNLDGKVAIVTGASRGVGAATAEMLARRGVRVVCAARATDAAPLPIPGTIDETVARIMAAGGDALAVPANL